MARRGRPRKLNGRRYRDGSPVRNGAIGATPEIAMKRAVLAGPHGDVTKTSAPLDLMELHGIVDQDTAQAAAWLAYSMRAVLGVPWKKNILNIEPGGSEIPEAKLRRLHAEYLAAIVALDREERDALIDLLHFRRTPFWVLAVITKRALRAHEAGERELTLRALAKLTRQWDCYHHAARSAARPAAVGAAE